MRTSIHVPWSEVAKVKTLVKLNRIFVKSFAIILFTFFFSCSGQAVKFDPGKLEIVNRDLVSADNFDENTLKLNSREGDGMAMLNHLDFDFGTIEVELKGEDTPGRSFVGIAFNVQNDSTYEAIYFRPFNFQSDEKIKRARSVQYIYHPRNTWKFLRTNSPGQYESEYIDPPDPNDWFKVRIKIGKERIQVFDQGSDAKLLDVTRLEEHKAGKIALWTGNNSNGEFRNLTLWK